MVIVTPNGVKKTNGRKKIEIKKIQQTNTRQVTFSKRRAGIFKKAAELCVLTGAEIAVLVHSPGGRFYAFGHPNPDLVIDRYLNANTTAADHKPLLPVNRFNQHYAEFSRELEMEKKRGRDLIPGRSGGGSRWYEEAVDAMEVEELERYVCSLEQLKKKVSMRADELTMINKTPSLLASNQLGFNHNNLMQTTTVDIPANTVHHGGFDFRHAGEIGRF